MVSGVFLFLITEKENVMGDQKTALISVYNKEGIADFARGLVKLGWRIIASGGTARHLKEEGIEVTDVAEIVGGGAILGHRVVTLSREVHAGLLARDIPEDREELRRLGIPWIDLVCCDLYPIKEAINKPGATIESVVEMTDIGGPTLIRAAAKGDRIVICDPRDRQVVLDVLESEYEPTKWKCMIQVLRAKAEAVVTGYCMESAIFHGSMLISNQTGEYSGMMGRGGRDLKYGENPYQKAGIYRTGEANDDPLALPNFKVLSGNPGFVNLTGVDRGLRVLCRMAEAFRRKGDSLTIPPNGDVVNVLPYIAIATKHGNPCGAAVNFTDPLEAMLDALMGNPQAVLGAEIITNFRIDDGVADLLFRVPEEYQKVAGRKKWGVHVITAPGFSGEAKELLGKFEGRSLLANPALYKPTMPSGRIMRPVRGGFILQDYPGFVFGLDEVSRWAFPGIDSGAPVDDHELTDLIIAWAVAWSANSNSVAIASAGKLIGLGAGQQDRRECCILAVQRAIDAGHDLSGSFFASDGFFPFAEKKDEESLPEGPQILSDAGCIGGIVPEGGRRLEEVMDFFHRAQMRVAFLPPEYRGFSQH
jgi:phosphoribosylaminoimidazolecarboxamide formyltransferase/IMP cyclohydrolase